MNKTTLSLIFITQFFSNIYAESFNFRDGTVVKGDIFLKKGFEPDAKGIILTTNNKLYLHHYPYVEGRSCAPPVFYPYYSGSNPTLPLGDNSITFRGYSTTVKCTPSRISFFNFETFTLVGIKEKITYSNIPVVKKVEAIKMINYAMSNSKPNYMKPSRAKTDKWNRHVKIYANWHIKNGNVAWGENLSFKNVNTINRRFTKKTRR
jgi:hypothetical protein